VRRDTTARTQARINIHLELNQRSGFPLRICSVGTALRVQSGFGQEFISSNSGPGNTGSEVRSVGKWQKGNGRESMSVPSARSGELLLRHDLPVRGLPGKKALLILMLVAAICGPGTALPQGANATVTPQLNAQQIVEGMQRHDRTQAGALNQYHALRHYSVVYRGFARTITAGMDVEVDYDAASGKSFRIISQTGSGMLCQKVLKRAVESEKEASQDKSATALTPANYRFELAGIEPVNGRPAYILEVEPISPTQFLYKGRIWVDAADFAVARMEVQPAKSPSFWISKTVIHDTNQLTRGFWLPEEIRSETKVRIGGSAEMTIDYGAYRIGSDSSSLNSALQSPAK
jgi:hypothetical protein